MFFAVDVLCESLDVLLGMAVNSLFIEQALDVKLLAAIILEAPMTRPDLIAQRALQLLCSPELLPDAHDLVP